MTISRSWLLGFALLGAVEARADVLTADKAVEHALRRNADIVRAEAGVLDARGGLYGAYAGVLPRITGSVSRFQSVTDNQVGGRNIGGGLTVPISSDFEILGTTPALSGTWALLDLSSIAGLSAAQKGLRAARWTRQAVRNDVALRARRQFYEVVKAVRLADVAAGALRLARDDERRVRALFEVGSVSKSDLLKAQLRSAQSELDSLTASQAVLGQRIALAGVIGLKESEMGEVDTLLTREFREYDEPALVAEAARGRPDLMAAEAELTAAGAARGAARWGRVPYITASGSLELRSSSRSTSTIDPPGGPPPLGPGTFSSTSETERQVSGQIALNWDLFDGFATDSRNAAARARWMRARENRDALVRNLESEVHQALLAHREAVERDKVARRALESATENLKLTQEKYNVGSATILELIDAQVQLQRAQSDGVSALASIRVAEAQIDRVRGRAE